MVLAACLILDIAPNVARAGSLRCVLDARPSGVECNTHFGLALGSLGRDKPMALSSTLAEQYFESRAGWTPFHGSFLLHYLDAIVYPTFPDGS